MSTPKNWDVIVLTAMDEQQKLAFELQINHMLAENFLPISPTYKIFADEPVGVRIGSGGATFMALKKLHDEFGEKLYEMKILLLHAGGLSQRQPNGSVLGKIFTLVPTRLDRPYTIFELKLKLYDIFLQKMNSGVFLAASDDLEYLPSTDDDNFWDLKTDGFTLVAHPSSLEIGREHGVYVLEKNHVNFSETKNFLARVKKVLQKPTLDEMYRSYAVEIDSRTKNEFVFTDSNYYFAPNVVEKFLTFFHSQNSTIRTEICAYGDFLRPLGDEKSSCDYLSENSSKISKDLSSIRRDLYELLRDERVRALVFPRSKFYHLGTFKELLENFFDDSNFFDQFHFVRRCFIDVVGEIPPNFVDRIDGCLMCSRLRYDSHVSDRCLLEICDFPAGIEISTNSSILSNCRSEKRHCLNSQVFLSTLIIDDDGRIGFVTVFCSIFENLKQIHANFGEIPFLENRLVDVLSIFGLNNSENLSIFGQNNPSSLWHAKIFRSFPTMENSFDDAMERIQRISNFRNENPKVVDCQTIDACKFYSFHDCIRLKNIAEILNRRKMFFDEIRKKKQTTN